MTPPQVALRQMIRARMGSSDFSPTRGGTRAAPGETSEEAAYRGAIDAATAILAAYDGGTAKHSDDVLTVSEAIADRLKVTGDEKKHLTAVAQLHDIGKIMVSSEILNKPGPLSDEEWDAMRRHTIDGEQMLGAVPEISEVADDSARLPRALRRRWISGRPRGRGHSAGRPHRLLRRRLPRDALRSPLPRRTPRRGGARRDEGERRHRSSIPWSWPPSATFTRVSRSSASTASES